MEVYLIRHTTPNVEKGICYGQTDLDIIPNTFKQEVERIRNKMGNNIDVWYSSPLIRCLKLAQEFNQQPFIDSRLQELNFGEWEMKSWQEIDKISLQEWMDDYVHCAPPGGESYIDLYRRCYSFLQDLLISSFEKVAITTHAGNIRAIISYILDLKLEDSFKIDLEYGALVKLKLNKEKALCKLIYLK